MNKKIIILFTFIFSVNASEGYSEGAPKKIGVIASGSQRNASLVDLTHHLPKRVVIDNNFSPAQVVVLRASLINGERTIEYELSSIWNSLNLEQKALLHSLKFSDPSKCLEIAKEFQACNQIIQQAFYIKDKAVRRDLRKVGALSPQECAYHLPQVQKIIPQ